jgi:hypothetical protein
MDSKVVLETLNLGTSLFQLNSGVQRFHNPPKLLRTLTHKPVWGILRSVSHSEHATLIFNAISFCPKSIFFFLIKEDNLPSLWEPNISLWLHWRVFICLPTLFSDLKGDSQFRNQRHLGLRSVVCTGLLGQLVNSGKLGLPTVIMRKDGMDREGKRTLSGAVIMALALPLQMTGYVALIEGPLLSYLAFLISKTGTRVKPQLPGSSKVQ